MSLADSRPCTDVPGPPELSADSNVADKALRRVALPAFPSIHPTVYRFSKQINLLLSVYHKQILYQELEIK